MAPGAAADAAAIADARSAVAAIAKRSAINLAAACSGGIVTAGLLGHLAATGALSDEVNSLTLLVCALDNERAGTTSALARRELAAAAVAESARRGYLDGKALANVLAWLRPNDLVWGYVINNYLIGKEPPTFDILYWNQDGVRLAAGLHHDCVRMALDNTLATPGAMTVLGSDIDLDRVDVDVYAVAGLNDHIVPWENAYRGTRLFGGSRRFVLSTSGHIQALVNPFGPESRSSFRVAEELPAAESEFLRGTPTTSGSWWPDYARWLAEHAGERSAARKTLGNAKYKPTAKAPGTLRARVVTGARVGRPLTPVPAEWLGGPLAVPGFLAGDDCLLLLRQWLPLIGYRPNTAGFVFNIDCADRATERVERLAEALRATSGRRVAIIGHSRGGHLARAVAARRPDLVSHATSMSADLQGLFGMSSPTRVAVGLARRATHLTRRHRDPSCFRPRCSCAFIRDDTTEDPVEQVRLTSIYSKGDGVVRWERAIVAEAECIEVTGSHVGLMANRKAYRAIAAALALPELALAHSE